MHCEPGDQFLPTFTRAHQSRSVFVRQTHSSLTSTGVASVVAAVGVLAANRRRGRLDAFIALAVTAVIRHVVPVVALLALLDGAVSAVGQFEAVEASRAGTGGSHTAKVCTPLRYIFLPSNPRLGCIFCR